MRRSRRRRAVHVPARRARRFHPRGALSACFKPMCVASSTRGGPLVLRASTKRSECYNGAQLASYAAVARLVRRDYIFRGRVQLHTSLKLVLWPARFYALTPCQLPDYWCQKVATKAFVRHGQRQEAPDERCGSQRIQPVARFLSPSSPLSRRRRARRPQKAGARPPPRRARPSSSTGSTRRRGAGARRT